MPFFKQPLGSCLSAQGVLFQSEHLIMFIWENSSDMCSKTEYNDQTVSSGNWNAHENETTSEANVFLGQYSVLPYITL